MEIFLKLDGGRNFREKQFEGAAVDDICIRADVNDPVSRLPGDLSSVRRRL